MIAIIAAVARTGVIGNKNKLPWNIPADLEYFKTVTMGYPVIMGRKTYESIGRALPGRTNVIITGNSEYKADNCIILHSVKEALEFSRNKEVFIIGGAQIFKSFLPLADKLYITCIDEDFEGDTFFPPLDYTQWTTVSKTAGVKSSANSCSYSFFVCERKKKVNNEI